MSLEEQLKALAEAGSSSDYQAPAQRHPAGWEPGVAWDGSAGTLTTQPISGPPSDWTELLSVWDLDPAEYEIVEPVQYRAWDAPIGEGNVQRLYYYRATIRRRRMAQSSVEELLSGIGRRRPKPKALELEDPRAFLVLAGDLQLGKPDGDGTAGTIDRFLRKTELTVARLRELRKAGRQIGPVYLAWLGDCLEGTQSQGGALAQAGRLDLTLTEQLRVYRRLMLEQIKAFSSLSDQIVVVSVPGNHDEAERAGKVVRRYDDSWAIEGASAVADALSLAGGFENVSFVFPGRDELTITLDICGTPTGFAHGHTFGRDPIKWWSGQAHGMQPVGSATLLCCGHLHHLKIEQSGAKSFVQIPALDGGSSWWRHLTGQDSPPGMVSLVVGGGGWTDLAVL